ncbi:hypothetical protein BpHYR1_040269 [Brachionus plicatilis]|uniref:Uncharacterized protein n=1 Tax=Brachionus plicatilis TaxID=10195 RepID=A0A3M7PT00_BRAPC|nr:hypothetical protein BpHYR1_040269 [Brachionus plicatilis]
MSKILCLDVKNEPIDLQSDNRNSKDSYYYKLSENIDLEDTFNSGFEDSLSDILINKHVLDSLSDQIKDKNSSKDSSEDKLAEFGLLTIFLK